ncbi:MAG: 2-phosphosulfolactate phosphatase [Propionicimonas sp.]|uniref:2-phosphosulfolactate phosphatase n=1 Tax=Propionicimonas sp. TaxID=1955623 RepID=UPI003D0D86EC
MNGLFSQDGYALRLDWGASGAQRSHADLAVVIDVLSFSTTVSIAVDRGMLVYPYRWDDESAELFARNHDAVLALGRLEARRSGGTAPSLSPSALLNCQPASRLVLPSPNGSAICEALRQREIGVAIGSLRNATAAAHHVRNALDAGLTVTFIAAGERWNGDDTLRPCLEDHLGAGAALAILAEGGLAGRMSPEARAAALLFTAHSASFGQAIRECVSGKELSARGFEADVAAAVEIDASPHVPVLIGGAFTLNS